MTVNSADFAVSLSNGLGLNFQSCQIELGQFFKRISGTDLLEARKQTPVIMANIICCLAAANTPRPMATSTQMSDVTAHATADLLTLITETSNTGRTA